MKNSSETFEFSNSKNLIKHNTSDLGFNLTLPKYVTINILSE